MADKVFFIAEVSANHNQRFDRAVKLIDAAADSGATAVKFQTYKPETMTLPKAEFSVSSDHTLWSGVNLFDLYQKAMTPWEWHEELFEYARGRSLVPFSSPFDRSAVDFLEGLDCPIYKIASLETSDLDLIEYVASTGKPMIISTGATTLDEIAQAVEVASLSGCKELQLLVCTSSYPAHPKDSHVRRIVKLREKFGVPVGLSDHTLGLGASLAAITLGARTIEKHITLSRADGGYDSSFSLEPHEFRSLVDEGEAVVESLGSEEWSIQEAEAESRRLRRSLFITKNVQRGDIATRENIKALRPNAGGRIGDISRILGKPFKDNYTSGTAATVECVE